MTLDEWDLKLPNGFHDAKVLSMAIDYVAGIVRFRLSLHVGWSDDPEPECEQYQEAEMVVTGLSFCSIALPELLAKCPAGTWCYRFFVHDWNAFIQIAALDAQVSWVGPPPLHAQ